MNIDLYAQDWILIESEEKLLKFYPKHIPGRYMPQPHYMPESYPCWYKEICIIDNPCGPDHAVLAYVYPD